MTRFHLHPGQEADLVQHECRRTSTFEIQDYPTVAPKLSDLTSLRISA